MIVKNLRENLSEKDFPITYEVVSPRGSDVSTHIKKLKTSGLKDILSAVNVPSNPMGRVKIDPVPYGYSIMNEIGLDVIPHLTCKDNTVFRLQSWLFGAYSLGLRNVLVITGDSPIDAHYEHKAGVDTLNVLELITGIKKYLNKGFMIPSLPTPHRQSKNRFLPEVRVVERLDKTLDFCVGAGMLPERGNEIDYVMKKTEAGADFFQTQIIYRPEPIIELFEKAKERDLNIEVPVLIGTAPIASKSLMNLLHQKIPHLTVPEPVRRRLKSSKSMGEESVEVCVELYENIKDLMREKGISNKIGAHIMPINSPGLAAEIVERVVKI